MILLCLAVLAGGCSQIPAFDVGYREPKEARLYRMHKAHRARLDAAVGLVTELKYKEAAAELKPLAAMLAERGSAAHAAEATFWLGYCREKLGNADEARKAYELVAKKYPDTPAARQAHARLTRLK